MADMSYEVVITREDGYWLADVPSVPGAHTFAKSLPSLYESIREVVVLMDDLEDDARPDITYMLDVEDDLLTEAADLGRARAELAEREAAIQLQMTKTIARLTEKGYSVRDVGALVGVSPGRVSQMAPTKAAAAAAGQAPATSKNSPARTLVGKSRGGRSPAAKTIGKRSTSVPRKASR